MKPILVCTAEQDSFIAPPVAAECRCIRCMFYFLFTLLYTVLRLIYLCRRIDEVYICIYSLLDILSKLPLLAARAAAAETKKDKIENGANASGNPGGRACLLPGSLLVITGTRNVFDVCDEDWDNTAGREKTAM